MSELATLEKKLDLYSKKKPQILLTFLYGSVAENRANIQSDVDIAFLFDHESIPSGLEHMEIINELSNVLHRDADLLILNTASPIIKMQVLRKGKKIYERDRKAYSRFFVKTINEYVDLKRIRANIEANISKAGIYD